MLSQTSPFVTSGMSHSRAAINSIVKFPGNGATHRCIINNNAKDPLIVSHDFEKRGNLITFTDTDQKEGLCTVYTLRKIGPKLTRLHLTLFIKQNVLRKALFNLFLRKKFENINKISFQNLNDYCRNLVQEGKNHPSQILLEPAG